ncbi:MAG: hypothetical protein ABJK39_09195 [Hyphomicrobiales bacterium]
MGEKYLMVSNNTKINIIIIIVVMPLLIIGIGGMFSQAHFYLSSVVVSVEVVDQQERVKRRGGRNFKKRHEIYQVVKGEFKGVRHKGRVLRFWTDIGGTLEALYNPSSGKIKTIGHISNTGIFSLFLTVLGVAFFAVLRRKKEKA